MPEAVTRLKTSVDRDVSIGGPHLAAEAIRAGLVDEVSLFLVPIVPGGGAQAFPVDALWELELADQSRFRCGVVHLRGRGLVSGLPSSLADVTIARALMGTGSCRRHPPSPSTVLGVILPKDRDARFVTIRRGGTLGETHHRLLALWAAA